MATRDDACVIELTADLRLSAEDGSARVPVPPGAGHTSWRVKLLTRQLGTIF